MALRVPDVSEGKHCNLLIQEKGFIPVTGDLSIPVNMVSLAVKSRLSSSGSSSSSSLIDPFANAERDVGAVCHHDIPGLPTTNSVKTIYSAPYVLHCKGRRSCKESPVLRL